MHGQKNIKLSKRCLLWRTNWIFRYNTGQFRARKPSHKAVLSRISENIWQKVLLQCSCFKRD